MYLLKPFFIWEDAYPQRLCSVLSLGGQSRVSSESQIKKALAFCNWHKVILTNFEHHELQHYCSHTWPKNQRHGQGNKHHWEHVTKRDKNVLISKKCKVRPQRVSTKSAKHAIPEYVRCWFVPSCLSTVPEVIFSDHKRIPLFCSCSRRYSFWNIIWFVMRMLLAVHPEEPKKNNGGGCLQYSCWWHWP